MQKTIHAVVGMALASFLSISADAACTTLDQIQNNGVLHMSSDLAYPPQSFLDENNQMADFDVEVGPEIARRVGVKLEIVTPAWEIISAGNWGGRWDVSVGSMTPTKTGAEMLDFPAVYYYTPASFAAHENSRIDSVSA